MVMHLNLGHLAVFHAVAEERSVTRGAERLLVSQPAASKQLRLLEQSLGTTLLERTPKGVRLTQDGEVLAGYARRIFSLEAEAVRAMQELRGLQRGRLPIGASTTIGVYLLPELFVKFRSKFPAVDTTLEIATSRDVERKLMEGTIDVGFIESPSEGDGCECSQILSDELVAIVPRGHRLTIRKRVTPEIFFQEPFIVRATGSDTKSFVERELVRRDIIVSPVMSLGTTEAIKRAVAAGIGVAIVSHLSIALELKAKTLSVVKVAGMSIHRPLYKIRRRGASESGALAAFLALLDEAHSISETLS